MIWMKRRLGWGLVVVVVVIVIVGVGLGGGGMRWVGCGLRSGSGLR